MRTQPEIDAEIIALEKCKAYIPRMTIFGDDNHKRVDLQIQYLRGEIDATDSDKWDELDDDQQSMVMEAEAWKEGQSDDSPSSGWDGFKPKQS